MLKNNQVRKIEFYILLIFFGFIMCYPLLWILSASFKTNTEIFSSTSLFPKNLLLNGYKDGWKTSGRYSFSLYYINSFKYVIPAVIGTVISSVLVAYGFARFKFKLKKILFSLMIGSLILPNEVTLIPRYIMFNKLGWLNSYKPLVLPCFFATYSFFIYMLIQYFRSIPKELDESAVIDGCNSFSILTKIILPLSKPAIISVIIFQFVWRWNDFMNPLVFINSVKKYPISLALRMSIDVTETVNWNQTLAMSVLSLVPPVILFFFTQKYFVEGIATTGIKG